MRAASALAAALALHGCAFGYGDALEGVRSHGGGASGWLAGAIPLAPDGVGWHALRSPAQGWYRYGVPRLVRAIEHAARSVRMHVPDGPPLVVGDLSALHGGVVTRHRSHRAGRDADLLFFALDAAGQPVEARAFVRFGSDGSSIDSEVPLQFDLARNWWLVESLARDDSAGFVWLFCSNPLRARLLEHAAMLGRPADVIARAADLLHQPGDSAAHDDHLHLRVGCTPAERVRGCIDGGPLPWWSRRAFEKRTVLPATDDDPFAATSGP